MSIRSDNTAHVAPGLLCWLCLVGVFLATGEWVSSFEKAQHYPVLLFLLALAIVVSSALFARGFDLPWVAAFPIALLVTLLSSSIIVLVVLWIASIHIFEFTLLRRTFGLGMVLVTGLPLLVLLLWVVLLVLALLSDMPNIRDARR